MNFIMHLLWAISWQLAILAIIIWVISRLAWKAPASWRYTLWLILLVKFFVPPFVHLPMLHLPAKLLSLPVASTTPTVIPTDDLKSPVLDRSLPGAVQETPSKPEVNDAETSSRGVDSFKADLESALIVIWLIGSGYMLAQLVARKHRQDTLFGNSLNVEEDLKELLADACSHFSMSRIPQIKLSTEIHTPMVIGLFRPTIVFPIEILKLCDRSYLKTILLHELAHLKRRDLLVIWLYQAALIFFFFHPVVWLLGRELIKERELACDEYVLRLSVITRAEYARCYTAVLKLANGIPTRMNSLAMAEPYNIQKQRIMLILKKPIGAASPWLLLSLLFVAVIGLPTLASTGGNSMELAAIQAGIDNSYSSVSSGKGKVQIRTIAPPGLELSKSCSSTFSDDKMRLSIVNTYVRNDPIGMNPDDAKHIIKPGEKQSYTLACDGKILTKYEPEYTTATRGGLNSRFARAELSKYNDCYTGGPCFFASMGLGIPSDYLAEPGPMVKSRTKPRIVGRRFIGNDECVIIEFVDKSTTSKGENFRRIVQEWINVRKGFCASRILIWNEEADRGRVLVSVKDSKLRQYHGGMWRASKITTTSYRLDPKTSKHVESYKEIITYSPDFRFNTPVSKKELQLKIPAGALMLDATADNDIL